MTEIELTLTDYTKTEKELEEIADSITCDFECGFESSQFKNWGE